jgi:alkylation response protein AidB-like acyl-CoA dehydrogenase
MRTASSDERLSHSVTKCSRISPSIERCFEPWWVNVAVPWSSLLQKIVADLVREDLKATVGRGDDRSVPPEAVAQFVTGGFFGLAMLWATGKLSLSVEEVNALFRRLAMPGVKAALRRVEAGGFGPVPASGRRNKHAGVPRVLNFLVLEPPSRPVDSVTPRTDQDDIHGARRSRGTGALAHR